MAPRRFSRYTFANGYVDDEDGAFMLEDAIPFEYVEREDNRHHEVREGDNLQSLAGSYFPSFERPDGLWWVIADFQPDPIIDPTVKLSVGSIVVIPSERFVLEEVFDEARRREVAED